MNLLKFHQFLRAFIETNKNNFFGRSEYYFKDNVPKIMENISLEKRNRPTKYEILYTFSRNRWVINATEDLSQHSLCNCPKCLKHDEFKKVLTKFPIKNVYLNKSKKEQTIVFFDRIFNDAFDISFSICTGIGNNDHSNNKKLTKPVNASAIKRKTAKLVKENIENQ